MKIRKPYMALCGMLFAAQMASAQQNMFVVDNNGEITPISVSSVDYATFNANDKLFTITNDDIQGSSTNIITADCTVALSSESNVKTLSITPEIGVCYSKHNNVPTIDDECLTLGSELKSYTFTLKSLAPGTTYYFRTYVKLIDDVFYGEVANAKTLGKAPVDNSKTINGHWFVDLGLPSGVLWAKTNIGAEKPVDDGNYYAWGETSTKSTHNSGTYFDSNYTTYSTGGNTTLGKQRDAASVNWGTSCRMPTDDEFTELRNSDNCIWTWVSMTTSDGSSISGYKVTSVTNFNSIFLPASGYRYYENLYNHGSYGYYWSSTLYSYSSDRAYCLGFLSSRHSQYGNYRYYGHPIRPVAEP